jgi:two-component system phosphate regulon sensor histidine kinase PhoR
VSASATPSTARYRRRLVAGLAAIVLVVAGAWTWSLYGPLASAVVDQQESYLLDIARTGAVAVEGSGDDLGTRVASIAEGAPLRVTVVAADGTVLADSDEDPASLENHGDRPEVREALAGRPGSDVRRSDTQGVDRMYVAVPVTLAEGRAALRVSTSLAHVRDLVEDTRRTGLALLLGALALATVAAWRLTRAAAGPVEALADSARAMAAGDLASPVPDGGAALAPLAEALVSLGDQMRTRLSALEDERRTLRLVLDGLSDAVVLLEGERVVLTNRALGTMFRLPQVDNRRRQLPTLGLPAPLESAVHTRLGTPDAQVVEVGPDPYRRSYRLLVLPLGHAHGAPRTLAVIADITDRARLDDMRRDFVANASHELKTPTAAIILLASSADQAARDGDTDQALAFLSQIEAEADRLRRMVADLLDLSRLESSPPHDAVTDVRKAVELALAGHRPAASAKGLDLTADLSEVSGQDVAVHAEATDLAVALDNLLANAVTYTERGSVGVSVSADDDTVRITVADTGIGIPPEDVERVFERFYRVDRARSRTSGGTGLGLSLVRNVAERSGGSVSIHSEPGRGTSVTITLRRAT